jgi:hypothetical protein
MRRLRKIGSTLKISLTNFFYLTTTIFRKKKVDVLAGSQDIECAKAIDEIDDFEKELIIMDRRIFFDDRRIPDEEIDYGQVLIEKK